MIDEAMLLREAAYDLSGQDPQETKAVMQAAASKIDELRSMLAGRDEEIERLTAENKDFQILYETQSVIIHTLTAERDAMCKKVWQSTAQLCHEMYMAQEYQGKIGYCHDDYADGIAEGMARCAKELAKKAAITEAKPLTTEQWRAIALEAGVDEDADDPALVEKLVRAIEAAHGIKEQP